VPIIIRGCDKILHPNELGGRSLKYNSKLLHKLSQKDLRGLKYKLVNDLHLLEQNQAQKRDAVRLALREKNVAAIISLSQAIRDNRRKPGGLRELNTAIIEINCFF